MSLAAQFHNLPSLRALLGKDEGTEGGLLDLLPVGVYVCDRDGCVVDFNKAAAELWGQAPERGNPGVRFCGSHRLISLTGETIPHDACPMAQVLATGEALRDEEILIERPDGSRLVALVSIEPIKDAEGRIAGAVNVFRDNTAQHEERTLLQALPVAFYTTDAEGRITFYNEAAATLWGTRPELGTGQFCGSWKLFRTDGSSLPFDQCPMALALRTRTALRGMEAVAERPDGARVPFLAYPTPLFDSAGALTGAANVLLDMTERHRIDERLRTSEARYRAVFDNAQVSFWELDFSGVLDYLNRLRSQGVADLKPYLQAHQDCVRKAAARLRVTGVNPYTLALFDADQEHDLLSGLQAVLVPESDAMLIDELVALWEGRQKVAGETVLRSLKGRRLDVMISLTFEGERAERSIASIHDITQRKASEAASQRLASLVESSDDAILAMAPDGTITSWNAGAERLYGYTVEEALGRSVTALIPSDRRDEEAMILANARAGKRVAHYETARLRKDGSLVDVSLSVSPIRGADGTIVGASKIARDISQRKNAELAAQRLAAIVASSDDAIVSKDLDGVITSWNRSAERLYGYTAEEAIGQPVLMLIPADRHEEEAMILANIRRGRAIDHYDTVRQRKDGSLINVSLTVSPIRAADGTIVGASKIARDITERHEAQQQQKLLLREMNHRIKNLLTLSSGLVSLSARYAKTPQELATAVQERLSALAQAQEMVLPSIPGEAERSTTLHSLIKTIVSPYGDLAADAPSRAALSGCNPELAGRAVTGFALLLHEFATNAAKYGALSASDGRIEIDCAEEGDNLVIVWKERGGPAVDPANEDIGFGSVLSRATVKGQLRGEITREWHPDGLTICLSVPKDRLLL